MTDADPNPTNAPEPDRVGFPYLTVAASLAGLLLFAFLVLVAYNSPNYLRPGASAKVEPAADPATKLRDVRASNQAVLDGKDPGVAMPVGRAVEELVAAANKDDRLPFPVPPKPAAPPAAKAEDKKPADAKSEAAPAPKPADPPAKKADEPKK